MTTQISELSKTYQYRKVMKPMLERKRRARINKCLDELKDLMVVTLESEGEHVTRLEKADILELTVSYLQKMRRNQRKRFAGNGSGGGASTMTQAEGFRSGYIHAVNEVSRSLSSLPGVNVHLGTELMTHLGQRLNQIQPPPAAMRTSSPIPVTSPLCVQIGSVRQHHHHHHHHHPNHHHHSNHYSVPLSPLSSSCTGSPDSSSHQHSSSSSLLTTCDVSGVVHGATAAAAGSASSTNVLTSKDDENVWRPW